MSWNPFKKKKEAEGKVEYLALPLHTLFRNILYDSMLDNPEKLANKLGLPSISEEVSEMEAEASEKRLEKISVLYPIIEAHAEIASEISFAGYSKSSELDLEEEDSAENLRMFFKILAFSSAISCLSTLVDLGLIDTPVTELDVYGK